MNQELKPCPFCGGEAYLYEITPHRHYFADLPAHEGFEMLDETDIKGRGLGIKSRIAYTAQKLSKFEEIEARLVLAVQSLSYVLDSIEKNEEKKVLHSGEKKRLKNFVKKSIDLATEYEEAMLEMRLPADENITSMKTFNEAVYNLSISKLALDS